MIHLTKAVDSFTQMFSGHYNCNIMHSCYCILAGVTPGFTQMFSGRYNCKCKIVWEASSWFPSAISKIYVSLACLQPGEVAMHPCGHPVPYLEVASTTHYLL